MLLSVFANGDTFVKPPPYARFIGALDGQNLPEVNTIIQDRYGYMWFGTAEGLFRYDGTNAKLYRHDENDPASLSHDFVFGLAEDKNGNIWVATIGGGLNKYDPLKETFTPINLKHHTSEKNHKDLYRLFIDSNDILWVGSLEGIAKVDIATEKVLPLKAPLTDLPDNIITGALEDPKGNIWFSTDYSGLFSFDGETLHHYKDLSPQTPEQDTIRVRNLHLDDHGLLWVASEEGIHKFNPDSRTFTHYQPNDTAGFDLLDNDIFTIQSDIDGKLYLGGVINGIYIFDTDKETFSKTTGKRNVLSQYKQSRINTIYEDRNGTFWFGMAQGMTMMPALGRRIEYLTNDKGNGRVYDVEKLDNDTVGFIANLQYYELSLNDNLDIHKFDLSVERPFRIKPDNEGNVWFAALGGHVQRLNRHTKEESRFTGQSFTGGERFPVAFHDLFFSDNGYLWLYPLPDEPHLDGGVVRLDVKTNEYLFLPIYGHFFDQFEFDDDVQLIVSRTAGFYTLNTKTSQLEKWQHNIKNPPRRVLTMHLDKEGNYWMGTEAMGLVKYTPGEDSFEYFSVADGLLSNNIGTIVEDNHQQLWLGTPVGLVRFDKNTGKAQNIEQQDGLLFSNFYKNSGVLLDDGRVLMGGYSGLVIFDPQTLSRQNQSTQVVLNQFNLFNQPVKLQHKDNASPLAKPMAFTTELTLSYEDYVFSFGFSALELLRPDLVEYAYMMEGLDEKWLSADAKNRWAGYTTLPAKDYTFKVKARHKNGDWSQPTELKLTITPPWWQTTWAMAGYVLTVLIAIYGYIRYREKQLRKYSAELEQNVAQRTAQLQASRDELAEKSTTVANLLSQKQRLFASISHEFRTPLTLILSPVDSLLKQYGEQSWAQDLKPVKRNGQRLLRMVDQLLEFAKLEQNTQLQQETVSVKQTLQIICESFETLAQPNS